MPYFQSFHCSIFSFPEAFFSQNAAFPDFCALDCLFYNFFIFLFLVSQKLFFAKFCFSVMLRRGLTYSQFFYFSIFSSPEAFFRKTLHFRSSALWNVLFPKFTFFDF